MAAGRSAGDLPAGPRTRGITWGRGLPGRTSAAGVVRCHRHLLWAAETGRDWTLRGFLSAQGSPVGLNVPEDKTTREAFSRAATRLFVEPMTLLKGRRLDAAALDGLLVPDPIADMLRWIDGSLTQQSRSGAFRRVRLTGGQEVGSRPSESIRQDAAARLAKREKDWVEVWDRFEEADGGYDGVVTLLRPKNPKTSLLCLKLIRRKYPP